MDGPDIILAGGQGIVRKNGVYSLWVLELGTKERNVVYKQCKLEESEKRELVKRSRQHKQALAHKRYRLKLKEEAERAQVEEAEIEGTV